MDYMGFNYLLILNSFESKQILSKQIMQLDNANPITPYHSLVRGWVGKKLFKMALLNLWTAPRVATII